MTRKVRIQDNQSVSQTTRPVQALLDQAKKARDNRKWDEALTLYDQALAKARESKDRKGEAEALRRKGDLHDSKGQPQKALESLNQALALYQDIKDRAGEVLVLHSISDIYKETGQTQKALEFFNKTLLLYRALKMKSGMGTVLNTIGNIYFTTGQPEKALEFYSQVLTIYPSRKDKNNATLLTNIASIHHHFGSPTKALEAYNQALIIYRALGDKLGEAQVLIGAGALHEAAKQPEKVLECYNQALSLYRATGDKRGEAKALLGLGALYESRQQPEKALECYHQVLSLYRTTGDNKDEAKILTRMGDVYKSAKQPEQALKLYSVALPIIRAMGDKKNEASTLKDMAKMEEKLGHPAQADEYYGQAVALYETIRDNLGGLTEAKSAYLRTKLDTYYDYLNLLLANGKTATAFEIAQKTKARSLLDLMASGRVDLSTELTSEERQQEQKLRQKADRLNQQMVNEGVENEVGSKKRFAALQEELKKTESQLQTLTDTLYARHPELAQKRIAKTATLDEVTKLLPADTALLEYIVLSQEELALFVVTQKGVQALTLPVAYKSLVAKATAFQAACADPRKDYRLVATELYKLLLAPAAKHLAGVERLVLCPDGVLWDVPFQALLSDNQFLVQRYELTYAYSATGAQASLAGKANHKKPTETLLAVANPDFGSSQRFLEMDNLPGQRPIDSPSRPIDSPSRALDSASRGKAIASLPGTQREADALKKLFPSATLMTGKAAQETKAKTEASKYKYLHFATHGFFNDTSPLLSSLVLAQPDSGSKDDGFLTAREIFELDLSAEMVVLSACNTARGVQRTGDGVVGLTWALFVAGCPTQVVSQWAVDDASTATLMTSFYGNLAKGKTGKGAALRQASLSLMQNPKYTHPYYWAPFVLIGDWR